MKILPIKGTPIFDLFTGEGWYNWTRILKRNESIKVLAGNPLTSQQLTEIINYAKPIKSRSI